MDNTNERLDAINAALDKMLQAHAASANRVEALTAHAIRTEANLDKLMRMLRLTHASIKGLENIVTAHEERLDDLEGKAS